MTVCITKTKSITFEITPKDLANLWWEMDQKEQALFFNELACLSGESIRFQLQYVTECNELNDEARKLMELIGVYSKAED